MYVNVFLTQIEIVDVQKNCATHELNSCKFSDMVRKIDTIANY